jgi:hypothetical protein
MAWTILPNHNPKQKQADIRTKYRSTQRIDVTLQAMTIPPGESKETPNKKDESTSVHTDTTTMPATVTISSKKQNSLGSNISSSNATVTVTATATATATAIDSNVQTIMAVATSSPYNKPEVAETKESVPECPNTDNGCNQGGNPPTEPTSAISTTTTTATTKISSDEPVSTTENGSKSESVAAPEIGPGWTVVTKFRSATANTPSHSFKYYHSPVKKYRLPSRKAVDRFQAALETVDGDETKAYAKSNGSKGATKTKATTSKASTTTKATTTTKSSKPKKQRKKNLLDIDMNDDPVPKRPSTTYLMYTSKLRGKIMVKNPNSSPVDISRILGGIWRAIPENEKDELKVNYLKDMEVYREKMNAWELRNPGKDKSSKKKKRGRAATTPEKGQASSTASPKASQSLLSPRKKVKTTLTEGQEWWEVEGFRDRRINRYTGKEEYLIKWRGCPESSNTWEASSNLNVLDDAKEWWKQETIRRNNLVVRQKRIGESMKRLGLENGGSLSSSEDESEAETTEGPLVTNKRKKTSKTICLRKEAPPDATKTTRAEAPLVEDETWNWDDASQVNFRTVRRISVHEPTAREIVTEARINGTPLVLTGHVGWVNFALRWLRRPETDATKAGAVLVPTGKGDNRNNEDSGEAKKNDAGTKEGVVPMEVSKKENIVNGDDNCTINNGNNDLGSTSSTQKDDCTLTTMSKEGMKENGDSKPTTNIGSKKSAPSVASTSNDTTEKVVKEDTIPRNGDIRQVHQNGNTKTMLQITKLGVKQESNNDSNTGSEGSNKPLDLSDPSWYLDIEAMSKDIGDEEVPVVKKNYNESKPISGNILASKFFEAGWEAKKEQSTPSSSRKRRNTVLYLHQWQFPLSVEAGKKLCHQSAPLPNNILGEDLLKYWLDRVKFDSPLQYLFMGYADTMSKIHRDNGGLAISIAPITGEKECILVHRDDGHACLYHNEAPLDLDDIDLNAYPLLPHARIWKTSIKPGEILLMPHGTYHQCRNVSPCLSYSRFHLDGVNLRAFLHSMMDGDAPELHQDEVIWNATRELIDVVDKASDEKRPVDEELVKAVDALRALRNIAKEVTRKLQVRQMVKGMNPSSPVVSSSVVIDGDAEIWQSLVDDVDMSLHEFRYRFNKKIPSFKRRRSIGRKILALPALPFRGKSKPSKKELNQGRDEPVVAFECPTDRGFLALPKAPLEVSHPDRKQDDDAIDSIAVGDDMMVRIEGRKCPARVTEVIANARAAWISFEDLPSLYNDFVPCDLLRTPSVGGSCLSVPPPEDIKPGKLFVCHLGKDEYRGVVQHIKCGRMFKSRLDFGNGYTVDKIIDPESILSVTRNPRRPVENDQKGNKYKRRKVQKTRAASTETPTEPAKSTPVTTSMNAFVSDSNAIPNPDKEKVEKEDLPKGTLGTDEMDISTSNSNSNSKHNTDTEKAKEE